MEQNEKANTLNPKSEPFVPILYDCIVSPTAPADALRFDDMFAAYEGTLSSTKKENPENNKATVSNDKLIKIDEENKPIENKENKKKKEKIIIPEKKFLKNDEWIAKTNEEYKSDDDFKAGTSSGYGFPTKKWKKKDNLIKKEGNDEIQINNEEIKCRKEEIEEEKKEERIGWPDLEDIKPRQKERIEESKASWEKNEKKSQPSEDSWSNVESSGSEKTEEIQPVPTKKGVSDKRYENIHKPTTARPNNFQSAPLNSWEPSPDISDMWATVTPKDKFSVTPKPKGEISNTTANPKEEIETTAKPNDEEEEFVIKTEKPESKTVKIVQKPWPTATLNAVNSRSQKPIQAGLQSSQTRSQRIEIPSSSYTPFFNEISSQDFDLKTYKTKPCSKGSECKGPCMDYHYIGEKRRDPKSTYFPTLCKNAENCACGDRCSKAHNLYEALYHPQTYMSLECPFQKEGKECVMGKLCVFTHRRTNKPEITIPPYQPRVQPQNVCGDVFHKLDQREKELEEYEQRLKAKCKCNRGIKKYVFVPCGHLICERCRMESRCVVCGGNGKSYMMH
ncbi:unnamed protein product [Blepharisma stoltei]|uniref:Uncharacterized protein n=1 Tax=Blepharisma stoltei TaxID=1481888 RepID=A0AAU9I4S8_9CILI|nr:unnamed protein product [Blepharisma stoltei]